MFKKNFIFYFICLFICCFCEDNLSDTKLTESLVESVIDIINNQFHSATRGELEIYRSVEDELEAIMKNKKALDAIDHEIAKKNEKKIKEMTRRYKPELGSKARRIAESYTVDKEYDVGRIIDAMIQKLEANHEKEDHNIHKRSANDQERKKKYKKKKDRKSRRMNSIDRPTEGRRFFNFLSPLLKAASFIDYIPEKYKNITINFLKKIMNSEDEMKSNQETKWSDGSDSKIVEFGDRRVRVDGDLHPVDKNERSEPVDVNGDLVELDAIGRVFEIQPHVNNSKVEADENIANRIQSDLVKPPESGIAVRIQTKPEEMEEVFQKINFPKFDVKNVRYDDFQKKIKD